MALFKISVTKRMISNNMVIEPGMSVKISCLRPVSPISNLAERDRVNQLFINNYGVDLKAMNVLNPAFLKVERL